MAIKLSVTKLNNRQFIQALQKLTGQKLKFSVAWNLKSITKKLDAAKDQARDMYLEIVKRHVELDEKGNIKPDTFKEDVKDNDGNVIYPAGTPIPNSYVVKEGAKEALEKEVAEYMSHPVTIEHSPLSFADLEDLQITAADLDLLEELIELPESNVVPLKK